MEAIIRKRHGAKLKSEVALEAMSGAKTINEIASRYKVHPSQVSQWKKHLQGGLLELFGGRRPNAETSDGVVSTLYEEIGRLKVELDWLKKKIARFG